MQSFGTPAVTFSFIAWAVIPVLHSETLCASYRERHVSSTAYVLALSGKMRSKLDFVGSQVRPIPGAERFNLECRREPASTCACGLSFRITRITGENRALPTIVIDPFHHHNDSAEQDHNGNNSRHSSLPPWKHWDTLVSSDRR
jgi:hypothetical protein